MRSYGRPKPGGVAGFVTVDTAGEVRVTGRETFGLRSLNDCEADELREV